MCAIVLLLMSAQPAEPVSLAVKGKPLLEVINLRLASLDKLVARKEGRSALPTERLFRYRFYSRSLVDSVQPPFPAGLPGMTPLLEHADSRVRCAALLLLKRWLDGPRYGRDSSFAASPSPADLRLRLAIVRCLARPQNQIHPWIEGQLALEVFPRLANAALSETEEKALLHELAMKDLRCQSQVIQVFLLARPMRFPPRFEARHRVC